MNLTKKLIFLKRCRGTWVAQLVERPTSAQVMLSRLWVPPRIRLCADSSEQQPASDSVSPSTPPPPMLCLSLPLKNKLIKKINKKRQKLLLSSTSECWPGDYFNQHRFQFCRSRWASTPFKNPDSDSDDPELRSILTILKYLIVDKGDEYSRNCTFLKKDNYLDNMVFFL